MIIGLFDGGKYNVKFDEHAECMGGSETWLCEIAKSFVHLGFEVHLYVNTPKYHTWYKNIKLFPKNKIIETAKFIKYDYFIWSRGIKYFDLIDSKIKSVILHDEFLTDFGENNKISELNNIFVLSEYSKQLFIKQYGNYENKIKITFNGVHNEFYKNKFNKTNSMVWSSCWHRGLIFFATKVLPIIIKKYPDFTLKICSYCHNNKFDKFLTDKHIKDLGKLGKQELAKEQLAAKIWCYPNLGYTDFGDGKHNSFYETFCITAVENGLANNIMLITDKGGFATTCKDIKFLSNEYYDKNNKIINEDEYAKYIAKMCIEALDGKYDNKFNAEKYTWINAAKTLI